MTDLTITPSREWLFEACALVHSRWSAEYDLLKKVKSEKDDGTPDWQDFHKLRLENHTEAEAKWNTLRLEALEHFKKL